MFSTFFRESAQMLLKSWLSRTVCFSVQHHRLKPGSWQIKRVLWSQRYDSIHFCCLLLENNAEADFIGETSHGQKEWIKTAVFYKETGKNSRVYTKYDPYFVKSLSRFSDQGEYLGHLFSLFEDAQPSQHAEFLLFRSYPAVIACARRSRSCVGRYVR